jgi:hypothetical protein
VDFFRVDFFRVDFFRVDFFRVDFFRVDFFRVDFLAPDDFFDDERFRGTFAPFSRASERPIAIACLRLLTFRPLPPLFSVPDFRLCIARLTLLLAALPYLRPLELFFLAAICPLSR